MGKTYATIGVTALMALGLLAGCGGGDDSSSSNDSAGGSSTSGSGTDPAVALFDSSGCAGCHTLAAADASGVVGPSLDATTLTKAQVEDKIRSGGGPMPAFEDQLSDAQISSLATLITSQ
jgi:mono/diheme cytochrome c family protein